ncbi:hypothetical protein [Pedobacter borealis]|uniref:hypothetical protein n=1 Tax=Pedobacter borealis TaxID=475254 RepID=UPI0004931332|nr:hypothetical protein [Pedobacter borealis]
MKQEHNRDVSDFTSFIYQKGYRKHFSIDLVAKERIVFAGNLSDCLKKILNWLSRENNSATGFELRTTAPYADNLECIFKVRFDEVKGFLINGVTFHDKNSGLDHRYSISSNHQIPGANSVEGLFPKPKPWAHRLKGKFRP